MGKTDPDSATDDLYARPPAEFVALRDQLAKQARAAGDRELATRIKTMRRPSAGAWYLNTAARSGLMSLRELLRLGQQLREAQSGGDFGVLRDLAARRGPLVGRVLSDLSMLLAQLGTTTTATGLDEARTTLASALADPEVAEQLARGRLYRAHVYSGFGELPSAPASAAAPPERTAQGPTASEPLADRAAIEATGRDLRAAEDHLAESTASREAGEAAAAGARNRVEALAAELAEARDELATAVAGLVSAVKTERLGRERVGRARGALKR